MKYDSKERAFLAKMMIEKKSIKQVQQAWRTKYKNSKAPDHKTISGYVSRFEKYGKVTNMSRPEKKANQKRMMAKNLIKQHVLEKPELSIRKLAQLAHVSYSLARDILKYDLKLKPYKYQEHHKLEAKDYEKRMIFAQWVLDRPTNFVDKLICTDEAYFYLTPAVNKQNHRMWLEQKPIDWIEKPLNDAKILVWCGVRKNRIYGPYFFETSVNQHTYLDMLKQFFWETHRHVPDYESCYFQQDGAPPHTANEVQKWLKSKFHQKLIDKDQWPPRSPDINPCDFFLWVYLKSRVYSPLPKNLDDLKANITREIKKISLETLEKVFSNFLKRCTNLISVSGGHVENE